MISTPDSKLKPRNSPAMPPNETSRSTHPNRTSRLYRMIGHVKYSTFTKLSKSLELSAVLDQEEEIHDVLLFQKY